jgi:hypothetical protein
MVGDYAGYEALFTEGVTELACLAHIRRKFFDLHAANGSPIAAGALRRIALMYTVEQEAAAGPDERLRQASARPALDELHAWLRATQPTVAVGSGTGKAIAYALKRWGALERYADSGTRPIHNNAVENTIRPIASGKKNWLFPGSERTGQRAAAIQSLLGTPKLNGLDPPQWLAGALERLPALRGRQLCDRAQPSTGSAAKVDDLRPGTRNARPQDANRTHRRANLPCRTVQAVTARLEREHERPAAPVPA